MQAETHSWSGYIYAKKVLIPAFVLLSLCSQPMTGCIQISFHCFKLTRFHFEIRARELSPGPCGDVKFLVQSPRAGSGRRGAPVSTGCQKALETLDCPGYSCWVEQQWQALCHSFLCSHRRPLKDFCFLWMCNSWWLTVVMRWNYDGGGRAGAVKQYILMGIVVSRHWQERRPHIIPFAESPTKLYSVGVFPDVTFFLVLASIKYMCGCRREGLILDYRVLWLYCVMDIFVFSLNLMLLFKG